VTALSQGRSAPNSDVPQTPTSPCGQQDESHPLAVRSETSPQVWKYSVDDSVEAVDEAVIARLRHAIAVEEQDDENQLNGVLRMLGAEIPDKKQLPLFGAPLVIVRKRKKKRD
jgi:hypothetical protein